MNHLPRADRGIKTIHYYQCHFFVPGTAGTRQNGDPALPGKNTAALSIAGSAALKDDSNSSDCKIQIDNKKNILQ